jgi:hypothetical protein
MKSHVEKIKKGIIEIKKIKIFSFVLNSLEIKKRDALNSIDI